MKISLMLDCYGNLLTEKQKNVMDLYYNNDLSLSEISEITKTSRQAIFDILKRCEKQLNYYEESLKLIDKSLNAKKIKKSILKDIDALKCSCTDRGITGILNEIERKILSL